MVEGRYNEAMDPTSEPRPITRTEFNAMARMGLFGDERLELLYGRIVPIGPMGPRHCLSAERVNELLVLALSGRARLSPAMPYAASEFSEPEPDFGVYPLEYGEAHPADAHLLIEVSHSSLAKDAGLKARLYAESEVPEYWVIDLQHDVVRVHRHPTEGRWTSIHEVGPDDRLAPLRFPDVELPVAALLGL